MFRTLTKIIRLKKIQRKIAHTSRNDLLYKSNLMQISARPTNHERNGCQKPLGKRRSPVEGSLQVRTKNISSKGEKQVLNM